MGTLTTQLRQVLRRFGASSGQLLFRPDEVKADACKDERADEAGDEQRGHGFRVRIKNRSRGNEGEPSSNRRPLPRREPRRRERASDPGRLFREDHGGLGAANGFAPGAQLRFPPNQVRLGQRCLGPKRALVALEKLGKEKRLLADRTYSHVLAKRRAARQPTGRLAMTGEEPFSSSAHHFLFSLAMHLHGRTSRSSAESSL